MLVEDDVATGILLLFAAVALAWLAMLWMIPGSADAYGATAERMLARGFAAAEQASKSQAEEIADMHVRISSLTPSPGLEGEHREIVSALARGAERDDASSLTDRSMQLVRSRRAFREIEVAAARDPSDMYAATLLEYVQRQRALAQRTRKLTEQPLCEAREALSGLETPRSWASAHGALLAAVNVYLDRLARYYDATLTSDDASLIAQATSRFLDSKTDLDAIRRAYRARSVTQLTRVSRHDMR